MKNMKSMSKKEKRIVAIVFLSLTTIVSLIGVFSNIGRWQAVVWALTLIPIGAVAIYMEKVDE